MWWGYEAAGFAETEKARRGQERGASLNRRRCGENDEGPGRGGRKNQRGGGGEGIFVISQKGESQVCREEDRGPVIRL